MSNTPRTDRYELHYIENGNVSKIINLARELELELAFALKEKNDALTALAMLGDKHERELAEAQKQRDALAEALPIAMARAYERGYQCGHEDTVESRFVIVHANDAIDYFADDVRQMLLDGSQPEAQKALSATKGESDATL